MREIKFRAWDKLSKKMCIVICLNCHRNEEHIVQPISIGTNYSGDCYNRKANNLIIMQYTGLKDKNGKEIYDGDILKNWIVEIVIKWSRKRLCWNAKQLDNGIISMLSSYGITDDFEIISNIHQMEKK